MNKERVDFYKDVIVHFGFENQVIMVSEECGELLSALGKFMRGRCDKDTVITELADVSIMVEQMVSQFGLDDFMTERDIKIKRLKERLAKRKESGTIVTHTDH